MWSYLITHDIPEQLLAQGSGLSVTLAASVSAETCSIWPQLESWPETPSPERMKGL